MGNIITKAEKERKKKEKEERIKEEKAMPKKVTEPFLHKRGPIASMKKKITHKSEIEPKLTKGPYLLLMKLNGLDEWVEQVKPGEFIIKTEKGEKAIILKAEKMRTFKYGDDYIKYWPAYEECMTSYPENPLHSAQMYRKTVQKLAMNWKERDEQAQIMTAKGKMWMMIIGAIALFVIVLMSIPGTRDFILGSNTQTAATVTNTIVQNITKPMV